jgi:hypothetical protein
MFESLRKESERCRAVQSLRLTRAMARMIFEQRLLALLGEERRAKRSGKLASLTHPLPVPRR